MKIDYLKINGFGKLQDKEIEFNKNINLIYGNNEAGKTTLLKCILGMFYGLSRNKNGKEIPDIERYKPWKSADFSGKIKYTLDSGEVIEVFREFKKKNPKIFNEKGEDITKQYNIDKHRGNEFFYEQTKIDEEMLFATGVVEQQKVVLENKEKAMITQKITNILTSGQENISYKKAIEKLNKDIIENIGTDRTTGRPINIIEENLARISEKKKDLNYEEERKEEIIKEKLSTNKNIADEEQKIKILKDLKDIIIKEETEKEKIKIKEMVVEDFNNQIKNINNKNKKVKKNHIPIILLIIAIIMSVIVFIFSKTVGLGIGASTIVVYILYHILKSKKVKEEILLQEKERKILEKNKNEKEKEVLQEKENIEKSFAKQKQRLLGELSKDKEQYVEKFVNAGIKEIESEIENSQKHLNNLKINLNTIEIEEKNIEKDLEKKIELEESYKTLKQEQEDLLGEAKRIQIVKEALESAYEKMKSQITPKFTKELSNIAKEISNSKYKNVKFNDEEGLLVELESGEYVNSNRLSVGTIEQLYLALRLSIYKEITEEKVPIILDEAFAYYDDERLQNALKYISSNFKENQIIILTCSDREKKALEEMRIEYNYIEI